MVLRLVAIAIVISLLWIANPSNARANDDQSSSSSQGVLLSRRAQVQQLIHKAEQRLRQLETDRKDKLEEIGELHRACCDLAQRRQFTKAIEDEIAAQTRSLHQIEEKRSDCLEELDGLYIGLSEIERDLARYKAPWKDTNGTIL